MSRFCSALPRSILICHYSYCRVNYVLWPHLRGLIKIYSWNSYRTFCLPLKMAVEQIQTIVPRRYNILFIWIILWVCPTSKHLSVNERCKPDSTPSCAGGAMRIPPVANNIPWSLFSGKVNPRLKTFSSELLESSPSTSIHVSKAPIRVLLLSRPNSRLC